MDIFLVIGIYVLSVAFMVAETLVPGMILGVIGLAGVGTATVYGFQHHWLIGVSQIAIVMVVVPAAFFIAIRRLQVRTTLSAAGFAKDYDVYMGKEGEALTDLRPAGMILVDGKKLDVVTAGEMIRKGKQVRVVKVEGNRVVVRTL